MKAQVSLKIPRVPNFIFIEGMEKSISIADLSDKELNELGDEWKTKLLEQARTIRKSRESH